MHQITKEALSECLKKLLETTALDKISVKDITSACGLNRQTFYYHFHDIYDLVEWTLLNDVQQFMKEKPLIDDSWEEHVRALAYFFLERRRLILHGYNSTYRSRYELFFRKWIRPSIEKQIMKYPEAVKVPEDKREYVCRAYVWFCSAAMFEWLEEGMPDEKTARFDDLFIMVDGSIQAVLERFISR